MLKLTEVKSKIPSITLLATTTILTAVENKIPNVGNLVRKLTNTKINKIENRNITNHDHKKYITIQEFNKLTLGNFTARF